MRKKQSEEGDFPRGIEVLLKKAAVDPEFRTLLLADRNAAANAISLHLDTCEEMMLNAVPAAQLQRIIENTRVKPEQRFAFLGKAAAVMLAALGTTVVTAGCYGHTVDTPPPNRLANRGSQKIDDAKSPELKAELIDLKAKIEAMESAKMASDTDVDAESVMRMKKQSAVTIGGSMAADIVIIRREEQRASGQDPDAEGAPALPRKAVKADVEKAEEKGQSDDK
jgi:hypothetical protein